MGVRVGAVNFFLDQSIGIDESNQSIGIDETNTFQCTDLSVMGVRVGVASFFWTNR